MNLPANCGDFDLTDDLITALKLKYPQIDVQRELYLMVLWLTKHRARRPKLMLRFIERWLSKCRPKVIKLSSVGTSQMSEYQLLEIGRSKGLSPRPGEGWPEFARRLQA